MNKKLSIEKYCEEKISCFISLFPNDNRIKLIKTYNYKLDFDNRLTNCIMLYAYTNGEELGDLFEYLKSYCSDSYKSRVTIEDKTTEEIDDGEITCIFLLNNKNN